MNEGVENKEKNRRLIAFVCYRLARQILHPDEIEDLKNALTLFGTDMRSVFTDGTLSLPVIPPEQSTQSTIVNLPTTFSVDSNLDLSKVKIDVTTLPTTPLMKRFYQLDKQNELGDEQLELLGRFGRIAFKMGSALSNYLEYRQYNLYGAYQVNHLFRNMIQDLLNYERPKKREVPKEILQEIKLLKKNENRLLEKISESQITKVQSNQGNFELWDKSIQELEKWYTLLVDHQFIEPNVKFISHFEKITFETPKTRLKNCSAPGLIYIMYRMYGNEFYHKRSGLNLYELSQRMFDLGNKKENIRMAFQRLNGTNLNEKKGNRFAEIRKMFELYESEQQL